MYMLWPKGPPDAVLQEQGGRKARGLLSVPAPWTPPFFVVMSSAYGAWRTARDADMTGRCCHAIELNPAYVDLAITRWQDFSGNSAIHAETGATVADVRAQRAVEGH
jgi:hypothetical protein